MPVSYEIMYIDTHAHLYVDAFDVDREAMVKRAVDAGVERILLPNIDLDSLEGLAALVEKYPTQMYPMMGLHPCSIGADYE